ncbi:MAG: two pore domain potassium channel family protein [Deltaproteobacteria bacterium]|nr:two pore domain potassium channel family protein [Deltaproteobacteria bacterium]
MKKLTKVFKKETRKIFKVFLEPTFIYLTIVGNSILMIATVIVYYLEKGPKSQMKTYFDSLWWGISTITTVAYGDILPQTFWGRIIGIALMYTGTVLFISFTGLIVSGLMKEEVEEEMVPLQQEIQLEEEKQKKIEESLKEISERLERLENTILKTGVKK